MQMALNGRNCSLLNFDVTPQYPKISCDTNEIQLFPLMIPLINIQVIRVYFLERRQPTYSLSFIYLTGSFPK